MVIAIASFIRKPADILQLCIADRRSHDIILPLLYENIVLHHLDYSAKRQHCLNSNVGSLCGLLKHQQQNSRSGNSNGPDFGAGCRSLNIVMHHTRRSPAKSVMELFTFLPFLRNLSLISRRGLNFYGTDRFFPIGELGQALYPLRDTLETLTLYIGREGEYDGSYGIGSLHGFKALKQLRIQSGALVGWRTQSFHEERPGLSLSRLLPPNLEDLTIHCCVFRHGYNIRYIADHFETRLDSKVSNRSFGSLQRFMRMDRRLIENVVVCTQDLSRLDQDLVRAYHSRLASCFDIVGRNMDSADEN